MCEQSHHSVRGAPGVYFPQYIRTSICFHIHDSEHPRPRAFAIPAEASQAQQDPEAEIKKFGETHGIDVSMLGTGHFDEAKWPALFTTHQRESLTKTGTIEPLCETVVYKPPPHGYQEERGPRLQ